MFNFFPIPYEHYLEAALLQIGYAEPTELRSYLLSTRIRSTEFASPRIQYPATEFKEIDPAGPSPAATTLQV